MSVSDDPTSSGRESELPRVSIVIPCYDTQPSFLERAVDGARGQSYPAKEILVIDDGSTDPQTLKAIDSLPPDVEILRQPNRGLAAARNRGFEAATGRYVLPLDSDDWIEPWFVEDAMKEIVEHRNAFVYPWTQTFGEYDILFRNTWSPGEQPIVNTVPYCILIPKQLWSDVGGYDTDMKHGAEDWDLNIRLALAKANGVRLAKPAFHYRVSPNSMLHSVTHRNYYGIIRQLKRKYPDLYRPSSFFRQLWSVPTHRRKYPLWAVLVFHGAHGLLPGRVFSTLFRIVV